MIEPNEEPAVAIGQRDPTFDLPSQHNDLMAEHRVFGKQAASRPERRDQNGQQEREQRDHHPIISDFTGSERE
jgi:hypothetical protein